MAQPLLSIGMIVKDEIRSIERCLNALQPLRDAIPCELVIADTGSTDGTREIVQQYADVCFDFEWVNDFAAARNAVLDRCSGKWALNIDADEYLDENFLQLVDFLQGEDAEKYDWGCVNILNYMDWEMKGPEARFFALRLARMDNHPRYRGAIHEAFEYSPQSPNIILQNVILHHNGYASDPSQAARYREKMKRNLQLLERELKQTPKDLRRLMQCLDSAKLFPASAMQYSRRAMKAVMQKEGTAEANIYGPALCCRALESAVEQQMPELEQWYSWAISAFPDSIFLNLDGSFALIQWYIQHKEYEKIPELAQTYLSAWKNYQEGNFDQTHLLFATIFRASRQYEVTVRAAGCEALGRLGRTAEAVDLLSGEETWEDLKGTEFHTLLASATWSAQDENMQRLVADIIDKVKKVDGAAGTELWDACCSVANVAFEARDSEANEKTPDRPWQVFSQVDGVLGQAARLMEAEPEEMRTILGLVDTWKDVPDGAVLRIVGQGDELPESFYKQSKERLWHLADVLSQKLEPDTLLNWSGEWDFTASVSKCQFLFDVLGFLLQKEKAWDEDADAEWKEKACRQFATVAEDFLFNYYRPELLSDEDEWNALPSVHAFALNLLQARSALQNSGDEVGYIHALRAALHADNSMKKPVAYLQEHRPWLMVTPEMQMLAEKVKLILAQYPEDDPAVVALKQSDAYKKVAFLLEEA